MGSRDVLRVRRGSLLVEGVRRNGEGARDVVLNLGCWFQRCPGDLWEVGTRAEVEAQEGEMLGAWRSEPSSRVGVHGNPGLDCG